MSDHFCNIGGSPTIISLANIFQFEGYTFEFHRYCGPFLLRKDNLEPRVNQPKEGHPFWKMIERWQRLPKQEQEKHRIYG